MGYRKIEEASENEFVEGADAEGHGLRGRLEEAGEDDLVEGAGTEGHGWRARIDEESETEGQKRIRRS